MTSGSSIGHAQWYLYYSTTIVQNVGKNDVTEEKTWEKNNVTERKNAAGNDVTEEKTRGKSRHFL